MTTTSTEDFAELAARVDELRDRVRHQERSASELLDQTLEAITEFNRRGLIALVHTLRQDPRGEQLLFEAVDRPEVMALLASHGIIRTEATLDVLRVVESIRPYLVTSSIEMDVERVSGDVAYVRFGSGCSAPSQEARDEIRGVILQRVPGLRAVEEVADDPGQAFIAVSSLRIGPP